MKKNSVLNGLAARLLTGVALGAVAVSGASADEIVVTAAKRAQTLQEVPIAVSVVGADTIEKAQIRDLIDLQTVVPSLRITQLQNSSQTNFTIRGFGNGANNPGIESSVGVFIDGVYRSRSAAAILDLPVLERVEVLRGPQSTLFGKNVSAGAISITTKLPEFEWGGSAEASYGNYDQVLFKGSLTGPLSDTLAFRVSGSTNNADGYYTNIVDGTDQNERDRWSVRGQLLWEPTDVLSFRLIGDYNKIDENCCGAVQILNGPATLGIGAPTMFGGLGEEISDDSDPFARRVAVDTDTFNKLTGKGLSLQADWDLGGAQLTSITSYREQSDSATTDVDFSGADLSGASFQDAILDGVDLSGAILSDLDLRGAGLGRVKNLAALPFKELHPRQADLAGADLADLDMSGLDLSGANLKGANLKGANLRGANLSGVNLGGANLNAANLGGVDLQAADLTKANLSEAMVTGLRNFRKAASFKGTNIFLVNLPPAGFRDWAMANGAVALWICVLNPLVLIHLMGGVHNEMLMVGLMAAGIALTLQRHHVAGITLLTIAIAVKATAGLALPSARPESIASMTCWAPA